MYGMGMPELKDLRDLSEERQIQSGQGKKAENANRRNSRQRASSIRKAAFLEGRKGGNKFML